jgi:hypothetical protein
MTGPGPLRPPLGEGPESLIAWWWDRGRVRAAERVTAGNRQLTAITGALLVPLLGLVFLTGLVMDVYWHVHYVIGFVLIPVVALKLASTGYRAVSYYFGRRSYHAAGPPELALRLLAPLVVMSTVVALATGVALWAQHSRSGTLAALHTDAAVICAGTIGIHVLAYIPRALTECLSAVRALWTRLGGIRVAVVLVVLAAGIALAVTTYASGSWPLHDFRGADSRQQ